SRIGAVHDLRYLDPPPCGRRYRPIMDLVNCIRIAECVRRAEVGEVCHDHDRVLPSQSASPSKYPFSVIEVNVDEFDIIDAERGRLDAELHQSRNIREDTSA